MPACTHCGLPVGRRGIEATVAGAPGRYCCYGCVLARQVTGASGDDARVGVLVVRLVLAGFLTMNVVMASMPSWVPAFYGDVGTDGAGFVALRWLALCLAAPVLGLLGWPIVSTLAGPKRLVTSADGLIMLGAVAAWLVSLVHLLRGRTEIFVDTACLVLVFVTVGRLVEARARARVGAALGRVEDPAAVVVRRRFGDAWVECPAGDLAAGDVIRIGPGEACPVDGVVERGTGGVSEAVLTGESAPVPMEPGSIVAGGGISVDGTFDVRVTARVSESARARIEALVRTALRTPSSGERLADRVAGYLVPAAALLAVLAGSWWWLHGGIDRGLMTALAVLVVACPCALGVATPAAIATALARAARSGVLVRSGDALERLGAVRCVVFDKTGTLTDTVPGVSVTTHVADVDPRRVIQVAAAVETHQPHPLARALAREAVRLGIDVPEATDVRLSPGAGVTGVVDGRRVVVHGAGGGAATVEVDGRCVGRLDVEERVRRSAPEALAALSAAAVDTWVLSGDRTGAALGSLLPVDRLRLGLSPEGKLDSLAALTEDFPGGVAMVGDGLNDAPTIAAATVGIAVGSATDLARRAADVVMLTDDLRRIPWVLGLARRTRRVLARNLAWAGVYNVVALAAAAAGRLSPVLAAVVMLASSLSIIGSSRRLAHTRLPGEEGDHPVVGAPERERDEEDGSIALAAASADPG